MYNHSFIVSFYNDDTDLTRFVTVTTFATPSILSKDTREALAVDLRSGVVSPDCEFLNKMQSEGFRPLGEYWMVLDSTFPNQDDNEQKD